MNKPNKILMGMMLDNVQQAESIISAQIAALHNLPDTQDAVDARNALYAVLDAIANAKPLVTRTFESLP